MFNTLLVMGRSGLTAAAPLTRSPDVAAEDAGELLVSVVMGAVPTTPSVPTLPGVPELTLLRKAPEVSMATVAPEMLMVPTLPTVPMVPGAPKLACALSALLESMLLNPLAAMPKGGVFAKRAESSVRSPRGLFVAPGGVPISH